MNAMKRLLICVVLLGAVAAPTQAGAVTDGEKRVLVRIAEELEQLNSLVDAAQRKADPDDRYQIDYDALRRDLQTIRDGVLMPVNEMPREPRKFHAIDGNYVR